MMIHGLFLDLPKFKDYRLQVDRHSTKRFPVLDMNGKTEIAIHHSLTRQGLSGSNAGDFARYHVNANGWPSIGYSYVIEPNGTIKFCNPVNWRTYHVGNSNNFSVGICLTGDFRYEDPTDEQKKSLVILVERLKKEYPQINRIRSHNEYPDYAWKKCCEFDYKKVLSEGNKETSKEDLGATYIVQEGDTYWSIAKGREFDVIDLEHANPKVDPQKLQIGQTINIPASEEEKATVEEKESSKYHGNSIVKYLESLGLDSSFNHRARLALKNGVVNSTASYKGTAQQNIKLLNILRDANTKPEKQYEKLVIDGSWGASTTRRLQQVLCTVVDGVISGQINNGVTRNIHSVDFGRGGSLLVKEMQKVLGVKVDGYIGPNTVKALQRRMGTPVTGAVSRTNSAVIKELQRRLNDNRF